VLDKAKKKRIFASNVRTCYINTTFIKSLKGGLRIMKKIFAIFVAMLFVASLSISVVGCKKAEEPAPVPAVETPAPAPDAAPAGTAVPAPEAAPAPAK
jgi:energy-converting hydrogenase Eha subunit F